MSLSQDKKQMDLSAQYVHEFPSNPKEPNLLWIEDNKGQMFGLIGFSATVSLNQVVHQPYLRLFVVLYSRKKFIPLGSRRHLKEGTFSFSFKGGMFKWVTPSIHGRGWNEWRSEASRSRDEYRFHYGNRNKALLYIESPTWTEDGVVALHIQSLKLKY